MSESRSKRIKPGLLTDRWSIGLLAGFSILAIAVAIVAFILVKNLVSSWSISSLDGTDPIPVNSSGETEGTPAADEESEPVVSNYGPTPEPWDGVSRVTILVMGLDYADTEERRTAPRSDTMILFTIDPLSKTAGILTIPRDMWVNIPGYGYNRINTAYRLGELDELPGGGPGLAMKTVEAFIGVPIQYYAQLDFYAFTEFIDNIGGVELEVPYQMKVDPVGSGNTVILEPGYQLLGGAVTLAYARNRYSEGSDFDRSDRQMQVIMAIRDKIVNLDMLPTLIQKSPAIYEQLSAGIHTNMTLEQIIRLALLAKDVPRENIIQRTISENEINFGVSSSGDQILKPITDKIRVLRDEVFTTGGPISPAAADNDLAELMKEEAANVQLKNGSYTQGLSGATTDYLKSLGVTTLEPGDVGEILTYSRIYDYTGNPYTVKYLVELLGIQENQVHNSYDPSSTVDVVVELGSDWANNNTLP